MRSYHFVPIAAFALLAACGDSSEDAADGEAMSTAELAEASEDVVLSRPGQYTSTSEIIELSVPGMPADAVEMIRGEMQKAGMTEHSFCLTEQDAAKGREEMLRNLSESDCSVTRFDTSGNSVDAAMECKDPQGMNGQVAITGDMGAESSDVVFTFDQQLANAPASHIKMRVKSQRTGDCT